MATQNQTDPWAEGLDPKQPSNIVYGELLLDLWFCALIKGEGKVVFDQTQHAPRQRRTALSSEDAGRRREQVQLQGQL
jgi:hypothetical protein